MSLLNNVWENETFLGLNNDQKLLSLYIIMGYGKTRIINKSGIETYLKMGLNIFEKFDIDLVIKLSKKIVTELVCESIANTEIPLKVKPKAKRFVKPSIEQVCEYVKEKKYVTFNTEKFYNYYESNGWKVGKNSMVNWKAAVSNWSRTNSVQTTSFAAGFKDYRASVGASGIADKAYKAF